LRNSPIFCLFNIKDFIVAKEITIFKHYYYYYFYLWIRNFIDLL
jgi:hypothetical protein